MMCTTCGSEQSVHGDCLVCSSPFASPRSYSPGLAIAEEATSAPNVVAALADRFPEAIVEEHLRQLPTSYRRRNTPAAIGDQIALISRANGGTAVEQSTTGGVDQITIATSDRPGILAALAGSLAAHGVNIVGGSAHTREDGVALDVLFVNAGVPHDDRWWAAVRADIASALAGEFPIEERLAQVQAQHPERDFAIPTTVYVDTDLSGTFTRVEVNTLDRVGLLYTIARAMHALSLDIHLALVETEGPVAVDTFYVRRADGSRLKNADEARAVQETLKSTIDRQLAAISA